MKNKTLDIILGRRLPKKIANTVMTVGEYRGPFNRYESWGKNIVKYSHLRDLNGKGPSAFYDLDGKLI